MDPEVLEWLHQAEYDYEDAEYLFQGKRFPKAIFCCHLTLEKGAKSAISSLFKDTTSKNS